MSNIIKDFLTGRSTRGQRQPVTNDAADTARQPVTRAEFATLATAVEALISDVDAVLTPGKLEGALNEAVTNALKKPPAGTAPLVNTGGNRRFLAPPGDGDDGLGNTMPPVRQAPLRTNRRPEARKPLALPADYTFLAPKGD